MGKAKTPLILIAGVILLGLLVSLGLTAWFDRPLLTMLALREGQSSGILIGLARFFTWAGDGRQRIVILLLVAAWLVWKKRRMAAVFLIVVPALAATSSSVLKMLFGRARPDIVPHLDPVHDLSFPSGHATGAFATYVLLMLLLPRRFRWPLLGIGASIALSRPLLGVHWPSDIIAGAMLGTAAALLGWMAIQHFENQTPKGTR